jgi:hypothetical protein
VNVLDLAAGVPREDHEGAARRVDKMNRFLLVVAAVLVLAAPAGGASPRAVTAYGSNPAPDEPKMCAGPLAVTRGMTFPGTVNHDFLCGTRGDDTFIAVGGGDSAWGYTGADDFRARNGVPDEVYGGPGVDKGVFDPCDRVMDVEHARKGPCPKPERRLGAADVLPFTRPVVECYYDSAGDRTLDILAEPQMRAVDATPEVDFQTVAWSTGILRVTDSGYEFVGRGSWFWDRVYDMQVAEFPGNYWRSFTTGKRTFVSYTVREPGTYVLGVYLHWYATKDTPARDEVAIARAHYGPAENADHTACTFGS